MALTGELIASGITGSIGTVGDALDNALMKSTIGLYKTEVINPTASWTDRATVAWATARWVHWYNRDRPHSSLDHQASITYETTHYHHDQALSPEAA